MSGHHLGLLDHHLDLGTDARAHRKSRDQPPTTAHMGGWYGGSMAISDCCFETDRLVVDDWPRLLSVDTAEALRNTFLVSLLTDPVTRDLPPAWQGPYDTDRASSWFVERQSESTVLLIVDRSDGRPVGLLILSEFANSDPSLDIRLGYMINTVTEWALENEKQVVKNEKRQRVDNRPYGHTSEIILENLYPADHPYHWPVIGSLAV